MDTRWDGIDELGLIRPNGRLPRELGNTDIQNANAHERYFSDRLLRVFEIPYAP